MREYFIKVRSAEKARDIQRCPDRAGAGILRKRFLVETVDF
jgi:hypothetical protein